MLLHRAYGPLDKSFIICSVIWLLWLQHWLGDDDLDKVMRNYDENEDGGVLLCLALATYISKGRTHLKSLHHICIAEMVNTMRGDILGK